jgi:hypothetical protein
MQALNRIILDAISECKYYDIDETFLNCEEKLYKLGASEREIDIRLFALALYCNKIHYWKFFNSVTFSRFSEVLDFFHFDKTVKMLFKKTDPALVVFWTVFRLAFKKTMPQNYFLSLENKIRDKSYYIKPSL